jgi:hypothetical protein
MNRTTFQIYGATKGVVQSGLVINLDAGNPLSYPGTGTLWTDLTGNGNNGTLVNGPTFNSANGGSVVFDGINDNVTFPSNISLTNKITVEVWVNLSATTRNTGWILGRESSYRLIYANGSFTWVCATANNGWYTSPTVVTASPVAATSGIFQVVGTYDGSRNRIYVNGVLKTTGGVLSGNILNINAYNLFKSGATNVDYGKGKLYLHRFYNKALSEKEVSQNFYATKERFGL